MTAAWRHRAKFRDGKPVTKQAKRFRDGEYLTEEQIAFIAAGFEKLEQENAELRKKIAGLESDNARQSRKKGVAMPKALHRWIRARLHPDSVEGGEAKRRATKYFREFSELPFTDLTKKPRSHSDLPRTDADLWKHRKTKTV